MLPTSWILGHTQIHASSIQFFVNKYILETHKMWMFPKIVVPQNGWFIMENPIKITYLKLMIWGVHLFLEICQGLLFQKKKSTQHSSTRPLNLPFDFLKPVLWWSRFQVFTFLLGRYMFSANICARVDQLLVLGMVIPPLIGNPHNLYIKPYYKVDDHPYQWEFRPQHI